MSLHGSVGARMGRVHNCYLRLENAYSTSAQQYFSCPWFQRRTFQLVKQERDQFLKVYITAAVKELTKKKIQSYFGESLSITRDFFF